MTYITSKNILQTYCQAVKGLVKSGKLKGRTIRVKTSSYKSYDDLPLFLNADLVAKVLGVSPSSGYELMHEPDGSANKLEGEYE